jgi:acyl-CoA dehydrogenase
VNPRFAGAVEQVAAVTREHAVECDRGGRFPAEALAELRRTGLLGLLAPGTYGGGDGELTDLVDATAELARVDLSVALIFAMHCQQVAALTRHGGEKLRAEVLPAVAAGECYLGSVTTAPGTGGHLLSNDSPAVAEGEMLRIDRTAPVVTGGRFADGFLITMRTPGASSPAQVDLVYAARDQLRTEVTGDWRALGMRATESVPMKLTGVVPRWQVVGPPGEFAAIATTVFAPLAHLGWAAAWLGTAAGALSRVTAHLRHDRRSGSPSELTLVRLATTRDRLETVHALLRHAVHVTGTAADAGATAVQLLLNTLKIRAADECLATVNELIELIGLRHGYLTESPLELERAMRDLRSAALNYGNDRLRLANGALALRDTGVRFA